MNGRSATGSPSHHVGIGTASNRSVSGSIASGDLASECGFGLANSKKVSGYIQSHHHRSYSRSFPRRSSRGSRRRGSDRHLRRSDRGLDSSENSFDCADATDGCLHALRRAASNGSSRGATFSGGGNPRARRRSRNRSSDSRFGGAPYRPLPSRPGSLRPLRPLRPRWHGNDTSDASLLSLHASPLAWWCR